MQGLLPVTILPGMAGKSVAQNNKRNFEGMLSRVQTNLGKVHAGRNTSHKSCRGRIVRLVKMSLSRATLKG